ncbi:MAG: transporter substrate-binding domain-containing protein [Gammaproteobacteria bacterium]|nr:transporter substrate-binding domain-containing protein [Gammaproteobacteria bacterium]MBU1553730.1 transporter substrate-binding domain-containing protein [Gammaproteobacteria bacterium]MBU2070621.1 transporter substrate-binding domain-containing protein [Gammaproteobacteria bacterium]MBU2181835.1 transporter substrate-binding domain-containing protein [Gammaproteobacteria bacterium]MBU2205505.1 transporter substrate-binding domain-containing protein [Gammaproteobacteria bacterium]
MKIIGTSIIIGCLCLVTSVVAEHLNLYTEHFPPYSYIEADSITGLNTELVRRSCETAGLKCQFRLYPWLRAYEAATKDPQGALYSTSRNALREPLFKWVGPLAHSKASMYRLKSRPEINPATLDDAKQYVIAVARGDVYEMYLQSQGFEHGVNLLGLAAKSDAVALFLQHKVDLLIASELILPVWLAQYQHGLDSVEPVLDLSVVGANYLALNPAVPDSVVQKLQQALDQLYASAEYRQLAAEYLQSNTKH